MILDRIIYVLATDVGRKRCQKRGNCIGHDGFKNNRHKDTCCSWLQLTVSINYDQPTNNHDSTKLIDVMENIYEHLDDSAIKQIKKVYADKGYNTKRIREYLKNRNISGMIRYRINSKTIPQKNEQNNYNKICCESSLHGSVWVSQN